MAYERMNLQDFDQENPFAAKHVDHLEDGIVNEESARESADSKMADDIQANTDLIDSFESPYYSTVDGLFAGLSNISGQRSTTFACASEVSGFLSNSGVSTVGFGIIYKSGTTTADYIFASSNSQTMYVGRIALESQSLSRLRTFTGTTVIS